MQQMLNCEEFGLMDDRNVIATLKRSTECVFEITIFGGIQLFNGFTVTMFGYLFLYLIVLIPCDRIERCSLSFLKERRNQIIRFLNFFVCFIMVFSFS